jgi:hypothetical protein
VYLHFNQCKGCRSFQLSITFHTTLNELELVGVATAYLKLSRVLNFRYPLA